MIENFLDEIFEKVKNDNFFANFKVVKSYGNTKIFYPIGTPYVTIGIENSETDTAILGWRDCEVFSESMIVTVTTDEGDGGDYCEETAENVCTEIMSLDSNKIITSVSIGKCSYDKNIFGYRIIIKFGLRETGIYFGGE